MRTEAADVNLMLGGTEVILMAERTMCFPHSKTLVLAGIHPSGVDQDHARDEEAIHRLERAAFRASALRIVIAGELPLPNSPALEGAHDAFGAFRAQLPLPLTLVEARQTRRTRNLPPEWFVTTAREPFALEGSSTGGKRFEFESTPTNGPSERACWTIATHVHPVLSVAVGSRRVTLPVFAVDDALQRITLPAFSRNCRGVRMERGEGVRLFSVSNGKVFASV